MRQAVFSFKFRTPQSKIWSINAMRYALCALLFIDWANFLWMTSFQRNVKIQDLTPCPISYDLGFSQVPCLAQGTFSSLRR